MGTHNRFNGVYACVQKLKYIVLNTLLQIMMAAAATTTAQIEERLTSFLSSINNKSKKKNKGSQTLFPMNSFTKNLL